MKEKVTEKKGFQQSCQQSHLEPTVNKTFVLYNVLHFFVLVFYLKPAAKNSFLYIFLALFWRVFWALKQTNSWYGHANPLARGHSTTTWTKFYLVSMYLPRVDNCKHFTNFPPFAQTWPNVDFLLTYLFLSTELLNDQQILQNFC